MHRARPRRVRSPIARSRTRGCSGALAGADRGGAQLPLRPEPPLVRHPAPGAMTDRAHLATSSRSGADRRWLAGGGDPLGRLFCGLLPDRARPHRHVRRRHPPRRDGIADRDRSAGRARSLVSRTARPSGTAVRVGTSSARRSARFRSSSSAAGWATGRSKHRQFAFSLTTVPFAAGSVAVLFLIYGRLGCSPATALIWSLVAAFCTMLWPYAGSSFDAALQAFWLTIAVWAVVEARIATLVSMGGDCRRGVRAARSRAGSIRGARRMQRRRRGRSRPSACVRDSTIVGCRRSRWDSRSVSCWCLPRTCALRQSARHRPRRHVRHEPCVRQSGHGPCRPAHQSRQEHLPVQSDDRHRARRPAATDRTRSGCLLAHSGLLRASPAVDFVFQVLGG